MRASRSILLLIAAITALPALATHGARKVVLLPEVHKHLDSARDEIAKGRGEIAAAHADMVLIDDQEVRYSIKFEEGVPKKLYTRCEEALDEAFRSWEKSLNESVEFVEVADPAKAHIQIRFKRDVLMGKEPVAGFANWKRRITLDGDRVKSATVTADLQIRTVNLDGRPMPDDAMTHEVMHEVGHVLGLEDCDHLGELMGPLDVRRPVDAPRVHEANAVRDLRDEARRLKLQALSNNR
ncbi:MAG: matrixin family metalloprotease [Fimbriimonas sp.]